MGNEYRGNSPGEGGQTTGISGKVTIAGDTPILVTAAGRIQLSSGAGPGGDGGGTTPNLISDSSDAGRPLAVIAGGYVGNYGAGGTGWYAPRLPNALVGATYYPFKTVSATSSGNTALWTPVSGKKFRLQRLMVMLTSNASLAAGAVEVISFQDGSTDIALTFSIWVPTVSIATGAVEMFTSPWIDLGNGILSATANNVLNVNLGTTLANGVCRVIACGQEE